MKMFGFRRRMKLGRLKVQLSDPAQGTRSPIRHPKRVTSSNTECAAAPTSRQSEEHDGQRASDVPHTSIGALGQSENWMVLSIAGEKPAPRFNHAATVIGNKMIVVGGESGNRLLDDVQVLNFDKYTWSTASSKLYLSPSSLPLKIPACKGHSLVSWGKTALLVGGKTEPGNERIAVWAFDTETECWSLMEAKGDIPVSRSGHTVVRASSVLILFGGEDSRRRKLNDLHMFDLKSFTWLPLHCTGTGPSARSNHVAALYDDKTLLIFGGTSKSRTLNDLYSLDFETMVWSRIKVRGFHPSPRAGCCGVLCGTRWCIAGGGSRKKRHTDTLIFDVLKHEWSVAVTSPPSSVTTNKGFSLVLVQHKEKDLLLLAFGGSKKEPSNQVEVLTMEKKEPSFRHRSNPIDPTARQNLASAIGHGSGRKSISEFALIDPSPVPGNISLRKQFHNDEAFDKTTKITKTPEDDSSTSQATENKITQSGSEFHGETLPSVYEYDSSNPFKEGVGYHPMDSTDLFSDNSGKVVTSSTFSSIYQFYEAKMAALIRKNGVLEGQVAAAMASREAVEKNLSSVLKIRQEMEKRIADMIKEMEMLRDKLAGVEIAKEEADSLSNIVHSDNVRLEHDVAFLKAVLDDTQKELHSTRGVLAGERARAFQLQVEVFHLKQRLQSMENRAPTPRKPFHM